MTSYFIFIIAMASFALLDVVSISHKNKLLLIASFFIFTFIGLRYEVGVDWLFYQESYEGLEKKLTIEPGYLFLTSLSSFIFNFWFFSACVTGMLILALNRFFYSYSPYPVFSLCGYFIISFGFNVEALRQIIAVALFFIALKFFIEGRKLNYYILCLVGSSLHISLLPFIFMPLIFRANAFNTIKVFAFCGFALAIAKVFPVVEMMKFLSSAFSNPYLAKIVWYATNASDETAITFNYLFKLLLFTLYCLNRRKIKESLAKDRILMSMIDVVEILFAVMLLIDVYFMPFSTITSRYDEYFIPAMLISFAYVIRVKYFIFNRIVFSFAFIVAIVLSWLKFSDNEYFTKQYLPYSNSLLQMIDAQTDDAERAKSVYEHWKKSDK